MSIRSSGRERERVLLICILYGDDYSRVLTVRYMNTGANVCNRYNNRTYHVLQLNESIT